MDFKHKPTHYCCFPGLKKPKIIVLSQRVSLRLESELELLVQYLRTKLSQSHLVIFKLRDEDPDMLSQFRKHLNFFR